jgi:LysM repeat protein
MLKPGQALVLPPGASSQEVVARSTPSRGTPEPAKRSAPTAPSTPPAVRRTAVAKAYHVRPGDTLWSIAQRFGTTVPALVSLNSLKQRTLKPGQVLTLPPAAPREVTAVSVPSQRTAAPAELPTISLASASPTALAVPIAVAGERPQIEPVAMQIVSLESVATPTNDV